MRKLLAAMMFCAAVSATSNATPVGHPLPPPLPPPTVAAPEMNSNAALTALMLLIGSVLVLRGRQTRR
jgi:hypothetical protein